MFCALEEVLGQEMEKKLQGDRKFTKQVKSGRILLKKKRCVPKFEHNASKEWGYIHESRSKNYTLSSLSAWPPAGRCRGCKPAETGSLWPPAGGPCADVPEMPQVWPADWDFLGKNTMSFK